MPFRLLCRGASYCCPCSPALPLQVPPYVNGREGPEAAREMLILVTYKEDETRDAWAAAAAAAALAGAALQKQQAVNAKQKPGQTPGSNSSMHQQL